MNRSSPMRGAAVALALALPGFPRPAEPGPPAPPTAPPITALQSAPVDDGFYLVPASAFDGAYRWREIYSDPGPWERRDLYEQYRALLSGGCASRIASIPGELPPTLIQVRRLGERYVIYDPCNGRARRLEIIGNLVEFNIGIEAELIVVTSARKTTTGFELSGRLRNCALRPKLRIESLAEPGWYRIPGLPDPDLPWVTIGVARTLDVLVNVCNQGMTREFPFDRRSPSPSSGP
ncbi:MAG TPA: hypothetical protein VLT61_05320 [Anaeromyxobacteraceae bacterium]|nr:hypothetical protein [Anaeromyxobacteraceae bacterium]